jgi:hypothetical protein
MNKTLLTLTDYAIRIYLSISVFCYAIAKILNIQFGGNQPYLNKKISELKGQDLVWAFYGHSQTYEVLIGVAELLAVFLLIYNRTKILGMFVLLPILLNIVFIDLFYEVSALNTVIYYSFLLLLLYFINYNAIYKILKTILFRESENHSKINVVNVFYIIIGVIVLFLISRIRPN